MKPHKNALASLSLLHFPPYQYRVHTVYVYQRPANGEQRPNTHSLRRCAPWRAQKSISSPEPMSSEPSKSPSSNVVELSGHGKIDTVKSAINSEFWHGTKPTRCVAGYLVWSGSAWGGGSAQPEGHTHQSAASMSSLHLQGLPRAQSIFRIGSP